MATECTPQCRNQLAIALGEFKEAIKIFAKARPPLSEALLAFEGNYLSLEANDVVAVMRAQGVWSGRATFPGDVLRALARIPPAIDPVPVEYDGHRLLIGNLKIACHWQGSSDAFISSVLHPGPLDLLALERSLPRAELHGSDLGKEARNMKSLATRRINKAAELLEMFGISRADLQGLLEARIAQRTDQQ